MNLETLKTDELLYLEFRDNLNSDPHFNYNENEFEEWLEDLVMLN
jgi:hypothetical protein